MFLNSWRTQHATERSPLRGLFTHLSLRVRRCEYHLKRLQPARMIPPVFRESYDALPVNCGSPAGA